MNECLECFPQLQTCRTCKSGFFLNEDLWCKSCRISYCDKCQKEQNSSTEKISCTQCKDGFVLISGKCEKCDHLLCKTCDANKVCTACKFDGFILKSENNKTKCVRCPPGKIPIGNECKTCADDDSKCAACKEGTGECIECFEGYSLNDEKICVPSHCPQGEFLSGVNCASCSTFKGNEKCTECQYQGGHCTRCADGYSLYAEDKFCKKNCKEGEYWLGKDVNICGLCSEKTQRCSKCEDITGNCLACNGSMLLSPTVCRDICRANEFWEGPGPDSCKKCSSLKKNGEKCTFCENYTGECQDCADGYKLDSDKFCRKVCPGEGFFWKGIKLNECGSCVNSCSKCSDITGICSKCHEGYQLNDQNFCRKICQEGEYWLGESNNTCQKCSNSLNSGKHAPLATKRQGSVLAVRKALR